MRLPSLLALHISASAYAYVWPSPRLEGLDAARWDQEGYNSGARFVRGNLDDNCTRYIRGPEFGRSNAADWIRTAYHDMATHNVVDGTGGLDGSIFFEEEQLRAENTGDSFSNTFVFLGFTDVRFVSIPDSLALLALTAIETCGGPEIPFRGGRIAATAANAPGVPEPQQGIDEHIASFARQGLNQSEMIGLIACGHSFGGVQHRFFPQIVPDQKDPNNVDGNVAFDSTFVHFDNNVATEYIRGTTANPLVVGTNETNNSDKRIFGSDNNATMSGFASSPELFASTCSRLFAKMLDTVPKGVQLTEVIKPLPVRPTKFALYHMGDGTIRLSGDVRLFDHAENPKRTVRFLWRDRDGRPSRPANGALMHHTPDMVGWAQGRRRTSMWYSIQGPSGETFLSLDATTSISKMSFLIDEGNRKPARTEDQGGRGFVMQDVVMFSSASCGINAVDPDFEKPTFLKYRIAVRRGSNVTRLWLESIHFDLEAISRPLTQHLGAPPPTSATASGTDPYELWTVDFEARIPGFIEPQVIVAEVNGQIVETVNSNNVPALVECA